jgi:hypothetical protein
MKISVLGNGGEGNSKEMQMATKHGGNNDWQIEKAKQSGHILEEDEYYDVPTADPGYPPYGAPDIARFEYTMGAKCRKLFWTLHHEPGKLPPYYDWTKGLPYDEAAVRELAQVLCPGVMPWAEEDELGSWLAKREPIFRIDVGKNGISATIDILRPAKDGKWDIIQISLMTAQSLDISEKYKRHVLRRHAQDIAFQRHCCEISGISIGACYLAHVGGNYIRKGKLDDKIIALCEITREVEAELPNVLPRLDDLIKVAGMPECPPFKMFEEEADCLADSHLTGWHCPLIEECRESVDGARDHLPKLDDADFDLPAARNLLEGIRYPLHIVDLSCLCRAIPIEGGKPYAATPFALYVLSLTALDSEPAFQTWVWDGKNDACKQMLDSLRRITDGSGSILCEFGRSAIEQILAIAERHPDCLSTVKTLTSQSLELGETINKGKMGELAVNGVYYLDSLFPESRQGISPDDKQIEEWLFIKSVFENLHLNFEELQLTLNKNGNRRTRLVLAYLRKLGEACRNA